MMDLFIPMTICALTGFAAGAFCGLWWSGQKLEQSRDLLDEALEAQEHAKMAFGAAIQTMDQTQALRESVEEATGVTIVPVQGRIG